MSYAIRLDTETGRMVRCETLAEDIRQSIAQIMETVRGQRIMDPEFGASALEEVDEPSPAAAGRLMSRLAGAIRRDEDRVELLDLRTVGGDASGQITIELRYRIRETGEVGTATL